MKTGVKQERENETTVSGREAKEGGRGKRGGVVKDQTHLRENKGKEVKL